MDVTDNALAILHAIGLLLVVGYAQNYYFHLRKSHSALVKSLYMYMLTAISRPPQEQRSLSVLEGCGGEYGDMSLGQLYITVVTID
jgi:hypothetical protein